MSEDALEMMKQRKTPIASFYCNLLTFEHYYEEKWFPYTMPISDIYGLSEAVRLVKQDVTRIERHQKIAKAVRKAVTKAGLSLYLEEGFASTVTVIKVPQEVTDKQIIATMKDKYGILISGCFDILAGKVFRLGHMGNNANSKDVGEMLDALTQTLQELGVPCLCRMKEVFEQELD